MCIRDRAIADPDRALVAELLRLDRYVDMIIPRGGAALHRPVSYTHLTLPTSDLV